MTPIRPRRFTHWLGALAAGLLLAACGGGGDGDQTPQVAFSKLVVFGDSLSDVGTYATPGIQALGGGKYTVNGPEAKIWVELLAEQTRVAAPCAAQTGLEASGPLAGLAAPIVNVAGCFDYAQGGSRVTDPIGPYNKALLALGSSDGYLGQITDPVINQIQRHLGAGGGFDGSELVLVLAGGNDVFSNLATVSATVGAGGDPTAAATAAVTAMGVAGGELAAYVKNLVLANGAKYVVVVNLPDVSKTPFALSQSADTQGLILQMSATFNEQLAAGLADAADVVLVDAFTQNQDQAANPAQYALSNVTAVACDPALATLGALGCTAETLIDADVAFYQYADAVHPTPYGHELLAKFVAVQLAKAGWL